MIRTINIRRARNISLLFLIAILLISYIPNFFKSGDNLSKTSIGYVETGITGLMVNLIQDNGLDESNNIKANFRGYSNPIALNNALVAGEIDVALGTGANAVAKARESGHDIKYFFPNVLNSVSLLAPKSSEIDSVQHLVGKKIGWYGAQTSGGTALYLILLEMGYTPLKDFTFIDQKPITLQPTLTRKEVDAILIFEPFVSRLLSTGDYKEILGPFWKAWADKYNSPLELSGYAAKDLWIGENKKTASNLIAMWKDAVNTFKKEPTIHLNKYHCCPINFHENDNLV